MNRKIDHTKINMLRPAVLFLCMLMACLCFGFPSFANDYRLKEAFIQSDLATGTAIAKWKQISNREEDETTYKIKVYQNSKIVMDWKKVSTTQFDLATIIYRYGKGTYSFAVYPVKGTEDMLIDSTTLSVDDTFYKKIKEIQEKRKKGLDEDYINGLNSLGGYLPSGWIERPEGNYQYRDEDHKLVRSCFKDIDGITYYFTTDGLTLTGWQVIQQNWYYFGSEGQLYKDTVTPDGSTVNEKGQLVKDGEVVTAKEPVSKSIDTKSVQLVDNLYLSVSERAQVTGDVYTVSFANPTYGKITDIEMTPAQKEWEAGDKVLIDLTIRAYAGCAFNDWTTVTHSSKVKLLSSTIENSREIKCTLAYTAGKQLTSVTGVYATDDYVLDWDDVPDAYYYYVTVTDDADIYMIYTVYDSCFDFSEYIGNDGLTISITAYAYNSKLKNIKNSNKYTWKMIDQDYLYDQTIPGQLKTTENGKLYYLDEFGDRVKNQTLQLASYYYTFDKDGYALESGWHKDDAGNRYYYDINHRMALGDNTIDGKKYHFNEGEVLDKPIGALISKSGKSSDNDDIAYYIDDE